MRHESLRKSAEFRHVLSKGVRHRRGGVTVVRSPGPGPAPRIGLVVGRSVGKAVHRNRVKRRLRHAMNFIQLEPGMDYVIIADRQVGDASFEQITDWLASAAGASQ